MEKAQGKYLMYKGLPLVRENNTICYGSMNNKCVLFLMILSYKSVATRTPDNKIEIPDKVLGQVMSTDAEQSNRIIKQFVSDGLYEALDFGIDVMSRYNKK